MRKALFIIHCQDPIYGASRSIGNLIRNLDADVDLLFPMKIKRDGITPEQVIRFYGPRVRHVWFLPQPQRLTLMPYHRTLQHHVKSFVKDILYVLALPLYGLIYRKGHYDFIHLNSATLYPMLKPRWPMFLHVREPLREKQNFWNRRFAKRLAQAHGIFYISQEIKNPCLAQGIPGLVLVNPYDQTSVKDIDVGQARERFGLTGQETVYAIIGNIIPDKGVDFVIRGFRDAGLENAVLLVVGEDTNFDGYERQARAEAQGDDRIRFLGIIQDIEAVYRVIDYIVRGDSGVGAGRTVFESLYSGAGAILMGSPEENLATLELPPQLEERVFFYPVRNQAALTAVFRETQHRRFEERTCLSNVVEYVRRFAAFVEENRA